MTNSPKNRIQELKNAIAAQESLRGTLADEVIDVVLSALRQQLADLEAQDAAAQRQRKQITVLFADVKGFTSMSERMDAEDVTEVMNALWQRLDGVIQRNGGRIDKHVGDAVMALWGVDAAREDDPERAVRAALEMQQEITKLGVAEIPGLFVEEQALRALKLRIGLHSGPVLLGQVGTTGEYTAMGDTVNTASRIESAAPVGGVLISKETYMLVRGKFDVQPLDPLEVKGKTERLHVYLVKRAKAHAFRMKTRGVLGVETKMVGRDTEFEQLRSLFHKVAEREEACVVAVLGDPGVGKSRLQFEFERWLGNQEQQVRLLKGRATHETMELPFHLWRDLFTDSFEVLDSDTAEVARRKLEIGLSEFLSEDVQMKAHYIGALLGFALEDSEHLRGVRGDPKQLRERAVFYLGQLLSGLAEKSPLVIFLEDIHWADVASLEALMDLSRQCHNLPILFVCLARPTLFEAFPEWRYWPTGTIASRTFIHLTPLSVQSCSLLVDEIFQHVDTIPDKLKQRIVSTSEGNPYYVEELINMLSDGGVIVRDQAGTSWKLDASRLQALDIPPTLWAVLQSRFDTLTKEEKSTLQGAAVIGRIFWDAAIERLPGINAWYVRTLDALVERELIFPRQESLLDEADEFIFKHALMRDAVYESVLKETRRRYHALVAQWFIDTTQVRGRSSEFSAVIAEHLFQAGDYGLAADWYLRAGMHARSQGAVTEARRLLDRALENLPPEDLNKRWTALYVRDEVLAILGELEARKADDSELMALATQTGNEEWLAEAYYRQGSLAEMQGDGMLALESFETALKMAQRVDNMSLQAKLLAHKTISLARLGQPDQAMTAAEQALSIAESYCDAEALAQVLTNLSVYYTTVGDIARATQLFEQQAEITQQIGNHNGQAVVLGNLGYNYVLLGLYDQARQALTEASELAGSIGARRLSSYCRLNLALSHIRARDWQRAIQVLEQTKAELEALADRFAQAARCNYLGLCYEGCGDFTTAVKSFSEAKELFEEVGFQAMAMDSLAGMARCACYQESLEIANRHALAVWEYLHEHGGYGLEFPLLAYLTCVEVFHTIGEAELARQSLREGYKELNAQAERISDPAWRKSYLENVWEHRSLAEMYVKTFEGSDILPKVEPK